MMPGLSGYETCEQLKGLETTRDIPVIFVTARDETASVLEGFRVGGVDYVAGHSGGAFAPLPIPAPLPSERRRSFRARPGRG
jgi:PleD family two-component response regulator